MKIEDVTSDVIVISKGVTALLSNNADYNQWRSRYCESLV